MDLEAEVSAAARRIADYVRKTPVELSPFLSEMGDCRVHLKLENLQRTGSFKLRGAMNVLLTLPEEVRARGVVAASTGNHGAGVACGAASLGCPALIFAPTTAVRSKLAAIEAFGAEIRFEGEDCVEAETAARRHAEAEGQTYVSPYNDPRVVAGQGTIGAELATQLPDIDAVFISVGGGGLISGTGGYLKAVKTDVEVIGASPKNSAVMQASLAAGRILDLPSEPTLSDGTAGGMEPDSMTFPICQRVVDDFILVSEDEIAEGVRSIVGRHHVLVEGAAGTAVGAFVSQGKRFAGKDVVIVLCGANIDPAVLKEIL